MKTFIKKVLKIFIRSKASQQKLIANTDTIYDDYLPPQYIPNKCIPDVVMDKDATVYVIERIKEDRYKVVVKPSKGNRNV